MKKPQRIDVDAKRWTAYAAASAATMFGGATAHGDITVLSPEVLITDPNPANNSIDIAYSALLGGTAGATLLFLHGVTSSRGVFGAFFLQGTRSYAAVNVAAYINGDFSNNYVSNLPYGQNISSLEFGGRRGVMAYGYGYTISQFLDVGGYFAFRFDLGDGTQYGWGQLSLETGTPTNEFTLEKIAWADAGESIFVGQTAIPEPGSLACLSLGCVGLLAWRRNKCARQRG